MLIFVSSHHAPVSSSPFRNISRGTFGIWVMDVAPWISLLRESCPRTFWLFELPRHLLLLHTQQYEYCVCTHTHTHSISILPPLLHVRMEEWKVRWHSRLLRV